MIWNLCCCVVLHKVAFTQTEKKKKSDLEFMFLCSFTVGGIYTNKKRRNTDLEFVLLCCFTPGGTAQVKDHHELLTNDLRWLPLANINYLYWYLFFACICFFVCTKNDAKYNCILRNVSLWQTSIFRLICISYCCLWQTSTFCI